MTLKIASLNINGIKSTAKQNELWRFIRENEIDVLGVQEFNTRHLEVPVPDYKIKIGYNGSELGSAVIYNTQLDLKDTETSSSGRIIKMSFKNFTLINVYGYQPGLGTEKRNHFFLRELPHYIPVNNQPVILLGDFNASLSSTDKTKGAVIHKAFKKLEHETVMKDTFALKNPG